MFLNEPDLVQEPLAGLLPAAGCAPQVPALHAIHFPALLRIAAGLPQADSNPGGQGGWAGSDLRGLWLQAGGRQASLQGDTVRDLLPSRGP